MLTSFAMPWCVFLLLFHFPASGARVRRDLVPQIPDFVAQDISCIQLTKSHLLCWPHFTAV